MASIIRKKTVVKRTISSQSVQSGRRSRLGPMVDDEYSIGDNEFHIEYINVPAKLRIHDAFHSLFQFRFFPVLILIMAHMLLSILIYAGIYLNISDACIRSSQL